MQCGLEGRWATWCGVSVAMMGCVSPTAGPAALVEASQWEQVGPEDDPFDDRPVDPLCPGSGWGVEELNLEPSLYVDTADCDYLVVRQPLRAAIGPRDTLFLRLWHYELTGPEGARAHIALWSAGSLLWESWIGIPADAAMVAQSWRSEMELDAGEEVWFHLHNHGKNSWNLIELSRNPEG